MARPRGPTSPSLRRCGDSHDGPDPALDAFFRWLERQPRRDADAQVQLARDYQATRRAFWTAALARDAEGTDAADAANGGETRAREVCAGAVAAALSDDAERDGWAPQDGGLLEYALRHDVHMRLSGDLSTLAPAEFAAMKRARTKLVESNLRLVVAVAKRFRAPKDALVTLAVTLPFADLIQEGTVGLMKSADLFDPDRGFRFSTYATWWIRHAINRALADKARLVRIPTHLADKLGKIARAETAFAAREGRAPTDEELAVLAEVKVGKVEAAHRARAASRPVPLHGDPDDADDEVGDVLARLTDSDAVEEAIACEADFDAVLSDADDPATLRVADALDALAPGDGGEAGGAGAGGGDPWRRNSRRAVELRHRLGEPTTDGLDGKALRTRTFAEVGAVMGVSREWARRWVDRGERFCRAWLTAAGRGVDD